VTILSILENKLSPRLKTIWRSARSIHLRNDRWSYGQLRGKFTII